MADCVPLGYGTGTYGKEPYGGSLVPDAGGPLSTLAPFDVYCVGPCGPISVLLTHPEVLPDGDSLQFPIGPTLDQVIASGGTYPTTNASITISTPVPENWTLEFTVLFEDLPSDFSDLTHRHIFFGASAAAGGCAGLFFSAVGLMYTGAVHVTGAGNLVVDTPVQPLPNSQVLISLNEYWTVRIAMSFATGAVYIYMTKTSELLSSGHQLRYVLPAIPSVSAAQTPPSQTFISVRGTVGQASVASLNSICLGSGLVMPTIQPHADAGLDQALRLCSVLQLDASKSFDPQGAPLLYKWRLIDAPTSSQYLFQGADGQTRPGLPPTGFTDRFYSGSLGVLDAQQPIATSDVLVVSGQVHVVQSTGTDVNGFYVRVEGYVLPDNLSSNTAFTYLRQNGLNTPTSQKPTFYPDVAGLYRFDLVVFDGSLFSEPAQVVVNVTEAPVARGCTPDATFLWNYLSDFWRLVEDRERVEVFWQGMAQVAAAELLNLWQVDYSKSLRDIQRTFQRKWLHYDLLMQEDPALLELSTVRAVFGGLESVNVATAGVSGLSGNHLDLQFATRALPVVVNFQQADPYTAAQLQVVLQAALQQIDSRITVQVLPNKAGTAGRVRIDAPFTISVLPSTTVSLFSLSSTNSVPAGSGGAAVGVQTYKVERSLAFLDIQLNDFLCVDGVAYRIARVVDDPSDEFSFQRVTLLDAIPSPMGTSWTISGTAVSKDLDFYSGLVFDGDEVTFEVLRLADHLLLDVSSVAFGASSALSSSLPVDASVVGQYLAEPAVYSVFLKSVLRRKYVPIDPLIVDVPYLQEKIVAKDDTEVLRRNVDYFIESFRGAPCLRFVAATPLDDPDAQDVWQGASPPARMWAEYSHLNNNPAIEGNFGIPADFTLDDLSELPSNTDYLSVVRGLWYAYFNGPTVFNLRAGTQILLGLPFAEEAGTIVELRSDFSSQSGRILVQDLADETVVRSYTYPAKLKLTTNPATGKAYALGDTVAQFTPLTTGVEVKDWVSTPDWFRGYLEQGLFFEVEKFFKFLVRVDSAAFNLSALLFVQSFILRIKPTYTYPLFVVLAALGDTEVSVSDSIQRSGTLVLFDGVCFGTYGVAPMFDEPRPAGGGWRSQFDANPIAAPVYPTPTVPIMWGYDKNLLCPEDVIIGTLCTTFLVNTLPTMDSLFQFDLPLFTSEMARVVDGLIATVPTSTPGRQVGAAYTVTNPGTINTAEFEAEVATAGTPNTFQVIIRKNGVTAATISFSMTATGGAFSSAVSIPVLVNDILTIFVRSTAGGPGPISVDWRRVFVVLGQAVTWAFDTNVPAGTYCSYKEM